MALNRFAQAAATCHSENPCLHGKLLAMGISGVEQVPGCGSGSALCPHNPWCQHCPRLAFLMVRRRTMSVVWSISCGNHHGMNNGSLV